MSFSGSLPTISVTALTRLVIFTFIASLTIYILRDTFSTHAISWLPEAGHGSLKAVIRPSTDLHDGCVRLPGADKIFLILKTGATALHQRLPIHTATTLKCVPNYMIISDLEQTIYDNKIEDVIDPITAVTRDSKEDFILYRQIQAWHREGQDVSKLSSQYAWDLDKWKFLPMIHKAFETASAETEWFVMIEADTSLSWLNLVLWLKTLDPKNPYYLGSTAVLVADGTVFAHGGSGIVMSRAAVEKLEASRNNTEGGATAYDTDWEGRTEDICCGDAVLAQAFREIEVPVSRVWPLIQGETPLTLDWSKENWCTPPATWHHVVPAQVDALWEFQKAWVHQHGWEKPYLFRDVFEHFVEPHMVASRAPWDNLCAEIRLDADDQGFSDHDDEDRAAVESADACAAACRKDKECMQWQWVPGKCYLDDKLRLGHAEDDNKKGASQDESEPPLWTSGWMQDRIAHFKASQGNCTVNWPAL